jgi:ACS family hexuronate transporter-like MFS transporter
MAMSFYAGEVLERIGSYAPLFAVAGAAYFLALLSVHLLSPRLTRVSVDA